jgi:hypothetical protein
MVLAAVALAALFSTSGAMADAGSIEVRSYSQDFSVSPATAEDRLETQELGTAIVGELKEDMGGQYSGVWFDNAKGEFVVPLTPKASRSSVSAQLAAAGLQGDFRTAPVRSSWGQLVAAQDRLDRALTDLIFEGRVRTSIDPRANAVVISEAAGVSGSDSAGIEALAGSESVNVRVKEDDSQGLGIALRACNAELGNCDAPMRGGVRIAPSGTACCVPVCSAGFKATDGAGNRYMLTAGHCVPGVSQWLAYTPDAQPHYLGAVTAASFPGHDYAAIKVNGNGLYWDKPSWPSMVAYWGTTQERAINSESWSYLGESVCHAGSSSAWHGATCGTVTNLHVTGDTEAGPVYNLTEFMTICSVGGDSGGPVFTGNTAVGLYTGDDAETRQQEEEFCKRTGFYSEITEDTTALGVSVGERIGSPPPPPPPPPTVQTNPATNIQEEQATLNGTVNPKGSETTYRFEYGKTTSYGKSIPIPNAGAGAGTSAVPVFLTPTLQPRTRYHFRLMASSPGGTSFGSDQAFTTGVRWYLRNSNSGGISEGSPWFGLPGEKKVTGDWDGNGTTTLGSYDPATGKWKLRNSNTTGPSEISFGYGGNPWTVPVTGDWDGNGTTTIGVYNPTTGTWRLKNSNSAGNADVEVQYGGSQFIPVTGDWDGNKTTTIGLYEPNSGSWQLRNENKPGNPEIVVQYGGSQFTPITGDWDGNKTTTIGLYAPNSGSWQLRNSNSPGAPNIEYQFGGSQFTPQTGDWDGNGTDTPVLVDNNAETTSEWRLKNTNSAGNADIAIEFGTFGPKQVTGDWNGDGIDTPGSYNPTTGIWKLRNSNTTGFTEIEFQFGGGPWVDPVVGDWDANGTTTIGLYDPTTGNWRLKNTNSAGNADIAFEYGGGPWVDPVAGDWNGDKTTSIGVYDPVSGNWALKNSNSFGNADFFFQYGGAIWSEPITGDWDANKTTTIGVYDPSSGVWHLRNSNSAGNPDLDFQYGGGEVWGPLAGDWNGDGKDTVGVGTR